jgi:hypothetical protein
MGNNMKKAIIYLILLLVLSCTTKREEDEMKGEKMIPNPLMLNRKGRDAIQIALNILIFLIFSSCISGPLIQSQRAPGPGFGFELIFPWLKRDESKYKDYYTLVFGTTEELLKKGQNPNKIKHPPWESSWDNRNPLWMAASDYEMANLLIKYGADATRRPYIARIMDRKIISDRFPDEMLVKGLGDSRQAINVIYEDYLYEKVKLFLEAGADPNMKGSGVSARLFLQTERNYLRWYNEYGDLPIKWAIKYSAFNIVDLLLRYGAILDDYSLKAAKEATKISGYTDMEDYINEVWLKQQRVE